MEYRIVRKKKRKVIVREKLQNEKWKKKKNLSLKGRRKKLQRNETESKYC